MAMVDSCTARAGALVALSAAVAAMSAACGPITIGAYDHGTDAGGSSGGAGISGAAGNVAGAGAGAGSAGASSGGAGGSTEPAAECSEVIDSAPPSPDAWEPILTSYTSKTFITAIAYHPINPNIVWVGYSDGSLFRSGNATAQAPIWTRVDESPAGQKSLPDRAITSILLEPDRHVAYVGFKPSYEHPVLWRSEAAAGPGTQMNWTALGFTGAGVVNVFQNPDDPRNLFVLDEYAFTSCSADGGSTFTTWDCAWSKIRPLDAEARITLIYREPGDPNRALVGFSNGELYETRNLADSEPSWTLRGSPFGVPLLPKAAIAQVTRAGFNESRCLLVLGVEADQQLWCGGNDLWQPASATLAKRQRLYGLAQRGRVEPPRPEKPNPVLPRLYLLTRYVGSFISDDLGSSWPYNDRTLKVQFCAGDSALELATDMRLRFRIVNEGNVSVPLEQLTLKYWYGIDEPRETRFLRTESVEVKHSQLAPSLIHAQTQITSVGGPVSPPTYADRTLSITFARASGELAPGATTGEIYVRLTKDNGGAYDRYNDYSFEPKSAFSDHFTAALIDHGVLTWGADPYYSSYE